MINKIKCFGFRFRRFYAKRNSESYLNWIRNQGVKVGVGCQVKDPRHILIDTTRPSLLEIGNHVFYIKI